MKVFFLLCRKKAQIRNFASQSQSNRTINAILLIAENPISEYKFYIELPYKVASGSKLEEAYKIVWLQNNN